MIFEQNVFGFIGLTMSPVILESNILEQKQIIKKENATQSFMILCMVMSKIEYSFSTVYAVQEKPL